MKIKERDNTINTVIQGFKLGSRPVRNPKSEPSIYNRTKHAKTPGQTMPPKHDVCDSDTTRKHQETFVN
jgi:hypothetical protein